MKCSTLQALLRLRGTGGSLSSPSPYLSSVKRLSFLASFPSQTQFLPNPCHSRLLRFPLKPNSYVLSSSFVVTLRFASTASSSSSEEDIEFDANEEEDLFQCKPLIFYSGLGRFWNYLTLFIFSFWFVFLHRAERALVFTFNSLRTKMLHCAVVWWVWRLGNNSITLIYVPLQHVIPVYNNSPILRICIDQFIYH